MYLVIDCMFVGHTSYWKDDYKRSYLFIFSVSFCLSFKSWDFVYLCKCVLVFFCTLYKIPQKGHLLFLFDWRVFSHSKVKTLLFLTEKPTQDPNIKWPCKSSFCCLFLSVCVSCLVFFTHFDLNTLLTFSPLGCHDSCSSCQGAEPHDCLTCLDSSHLLKDGFCVSDCGVGFYASQGNCYGMMMGRIHILVTCGFVCVLLSNGMKHFNICFNLTIE